MPPSSEKKNVFMAIPAQMEGFGEFSVASFPPEQTHEQSLHISNMHLATN